jgi:hypothetical protein
MNDDHVDDKHHEKINFPIVDNLLLSVIIIDKS